MICKTYVLMIYSHNVTDDIQGWRLDDIQPFGLMICKAGADGAVKLAVQVKNDKNAKESRQNEQY